MNESDYIGIDSTPIKYNKLNNQQVCDIVEDFNGNPNISLDKLARSHNTNMSTVSRILTDVLFNKPENPVSIYLKSKV